MSSTRTGQRLQIFGSVTLTLAALFSSLLWETSAQAVQYVINISCDALRPDAISKWVNNPSNPLPNFKRLRNQGAFTDNARTDYYETCTSPGHANMLTGYPVNGPRGHLWGENQEDPWGNYGLTFHDAHTAGKTYNHENGPVVWPKAGLPNKPDYDYVYSVFDVAHDAGLRTGLYAGKVRFEMYPHSYDAAHSYNGINKIDDNLILPVGLDGTPSSQQLINRWKTQMDSKNPLRYSFIHFADTDDFGHKYGWDLSSLSTPYMQAVDREDQWLGQIFAEINGDPRLKGNTAIVLTADHAGSANYPDNGADGHNDPTLAKNYTVPFYVWGPGVTAGADLYALNSDNPEFKNPGTGRPTQGYYSQPIRNGCMPNVSLDLLGLKSVPESTFDYDQSLKWSSSLTTPRSALQSSLTGPGLSLSGYGSSIVPEPAAGVLLVVGAALLAVARLLAMGIARSDCRY